MTSDDETGQPSIADDSTPLPYADAARALAASTARVERVGDPAEQVALVRPHELLVRAAAVDRLRAALAPVGMQVLGRLTDDLLHVLVTDDVDLTPLVESLRGTGDRPDVTFNHVFVACAATPTDSTAPGDDPAGDSDANDDPAGGDTGPKRGEWWGGVPGSGGAGMRAFADLGAAAAATTAVSAGVTPTAPDGTRDGADARGDTGDGTGNDPADGTAATSNPGALQGEWWGGPIGSPKPVAPFDPPTRASSASDVAASTGDTGERTARVALLDTGIVSHPWWADSEWFANVADDDIERLGDNTNPVPLPSEAGHGTFVAGVVLQHASGAYIDIQRVLAGDGLCDEAELIAVLYELAALPASQMPDVINMSFGGYTVGDRTPQFVADALAALPRTTALVAAAGNFASDRPFWPAALPVVTAVGALNADGEKRATFSNYGPWVDCYRVGVRVRSSYISYPATERPDGTQTPAFSGYARWNGTSFAAPAVAGEALASSATAGVDARAAAVEVAARTVAPEAATP